MIQGKALVAPEGHVAPERQDEGARGCCTMLPPSVSSLRTLFGLTPLANQYPALHGLRVLGILSVIQIHLSFELAVKGLLPAKGGLFTLSQKIWFGMDLFFVLSGFLIGNILLSADGALGARKILRFYARRSFRIVPLYYVVLLGLAWMRPLDALQRAQLPRELLYLTNYSDVRHVVMFWGWSLCVEEHFYLAVPFLVIALAKLRSHRSRLLFLTVLWASAFGVRALVVHARVVPLDAAGYFRHVYIATHTRYDTLVAGIFLAYVHRHFGEAIVRAFARPWIRRVAALAGATLFFALLFPPPVLATAISSLLALGTITSAAWVIVLLHLLSVDSAASRLLGRPIFLRFATLGYGVYLVHMPLVLAVGIGAFRWLHVELDVPEGVAFLLGVGAVFGVALAIAYALHLVVEKPALRARDALVAPAPQRPPALEAEPTA